MLLSQEAVAALFFQLCCALALRHEGLHLCVQTIHTLLGAGGEDSGWGPEPFGLRCPFSQSSPEHQFASSPCDPLAWVPGYHDCLWYPEQGRAEVAIERMVYGNRNGRMSDALLGRERETGAH